MQSDSKIVRFILVSPYFLLLFTVIPATLIFSRLLHVSLPFSITVNTLHGNNIILLLSLIIRFITSAAGLRQTVRYGSDLSRRAAVLDLGRKAFALRSELTGAGYCFDSVGAYGEKRDIGYIGKVLVYGGLSFLLFFGVWDNLGQFSGTVLKGPGAAVDLSQADKYFLLINGPLASSSGLPQLKVTNQYFPDSTYPLGATEIVLSDKKGRQVGGAFLNAVKKPYRFSNYDVYLNSLFVDFALTIKTKDSVENNVFDDSVKVLPLYASKVGDFTLYGTFVTPAGAEGEAWFDPIHDLFRIVLKHRGRTILDTDYKFQGYREKEAGNLVVSVKGLGRWSEIHVVRRRHMSMLFVGGIIAALGLLMRVVYRPQRVWLEETAEGCRVRYVGKKPF